MAIFIKNKVLMEPIRAQLGNTKQLLISPDGQLNLLPFAALVDEKGEYLVENYSITYLTTGRDLIRLQYTPPSQNPPLILANPDYIQANPSQTVASRGEAKRSMDLAQLRVDSLPGAAEEGQVLATLLRDGVILTGNGATENVVKQTPSPRILHLATHGFFLPDIEQSTPPTRPVSSGQSLSALGIVENPLLRSGLALAGFNERRLFRRGIGGGWGSERLICLAHLTKDWGVFGCFPINLIRWRGNQDY
ncbi:CHAT domain-containing protein [Spirulina subsalsa]|uniref:CHAT domain-containing protein n=1 Tax=Spirulina subsalsa TaxID=54311 RepID=UPI001ED9B96B|nr:CHAT domain-containing protein [Spirulina subsalsa]